LAGTSRASHEDHSVGRVDRLAETRDRLFIQPHGVDASGECRFIEDTDADLFTMRGGQNRDTQIDLSPHHLDAEPSILRYTALRDVETGENLDARRDRELERFWRRLRRGQVAINAVAQFQRPIKRLNVNI